jgi:hypothetical protein
MPKVKSAWILPTEEVIYLENLSHAEIIVKFLTGLFVKDTVLAKYCLRDFKRFMEREEYIGMKVIDIVEDYAVFCLRWVKIGNAYNFKDNKTMTIANYDAHEEKIKRYNDIGFYVSVLPIKLHCYETIGQAEYQKLNVKEIIKNGNTDYKAYLNM